MFERQARARQDEARQALRNGDGEPGADADPLPRPDPGALGRVQVEARVGVVGAGRNRGRFAEAYESEWVYRAAERALSRPRRGLGLV